jgi:hypothetical protein
MKKILLSVLIILCSLISYSQNVFQKAYDASIGTREDVNSPVEWYVKNKEVNIVICYEDDKVKIFADETKTYRSIKLIEDNEEYTNWLMVDDKGLKCYLSVGVHKETKLSYLKIEYVDTVILYFTKPN